MTKSKKQFFLYKPKTVEGLYFVSILMLVFSFLLLGTTLLLKSTGKDNLTAIGVQEPFKIGEYLTSGDVGLKVLGVNFDQGKQPFVAPDGSTYVVVRLSVNNRSDQPINILPTTDTYVKTADGTVSYLSPFFVSDPFRAGELSPGDTIQGELSYLVENDVPLKFYIDGIWSGSSIPIKIN